MEKPHISENNEFVAQQRRAHAEVTAGIEAEVDALHELSAIKRAGEIAFFVSFYVLGAAIITVTSGIAWAIIATIFMGIALNSLGIFIHEGLHGLFAKNRKINHLCSFLVGLPLLVSATAYQVTHVTHHFELGKKLDYGTYKQHVKRPVFVWIAYVAQLFGGCIFYMLLIPILAFRSASPRSRKFILLEYAVIVGVFATFFYVVPLTAVLQYWFYPALIYMMLTNIRGLASHALGDVEDIYLSSRTITCSPLMSMLFINENYHLEHHLFPRVPSYNLAKLHKLIWQRLPKAIHSKSYLHFLGSFLKAVWKNELKPMGVVKPGSDKIAS